MKHDLSGKLWQEATQLLPGGVNSPVRAFRGVGGMPFFTQRAKGARLWDVDGNEYIDYVGSWGPMILGHTHPKVIQAVVDAASRVWAIPAAYIKLKTGKRPRPTAIEASDRR